MESVLKTILYEWLERKLPETIERETKLDLKEDFLVKKITVVTGFRRSGKTYLLFHHIKKLLKRYSKKEVVYINFEDERIVPDVSFLSQLLPMIQAVYGDKPKYLFLDEIQNIPLWSKWLRRVVDAESVKIFLTGSSSKISSVELPSELRGRCFEVKIFPLNLREFFRFKNFIVDKEKIKYLADEKAKFEFLFNEYLLWGGMPEVVLLPVEKKQETLQNYFATVVKKEIIDRYKIKNELAIKTLLKLIVNSTYITVSKLYHTLKSLGLAIGKTTVNQYLSFIESSYFFTPVYFYSPSMINQLKYPRKPYLIDNGFITSLSTKFSKNYSRLFEHFVFWHLKLKEESLFYYQDKNKNEVDFVVLKDEKPEALYQACYDISDFETKEREIKSLKKAKNKLNGLNLFLVTKDFKAKLNEKDIHILTPLDFC